MTYDLAIKEIFEAARTLKEDIKASVWYERNMVMPAQNPIPGPFSYDNSPYWREPVDNISPDSDVSEMTIMTVNQIGKTDAFINACIGYIVSECPGPIQYLTGHQDGNAEAMRRIDQMFDATGIRARGLIKDQSNRARKTKSGDTDIRKDFLHGHLIMGVLTNVKKDARQHTIKYQFRDDMDAAPIITKSGDTASVFKTRVDSFGSRAKVVNISSPEISGQSNIEKAFNRSDKRYFNVPCPKCLKPITLEWEVELGKNKAGLFWRLDSAGRLIESSIEYVCQLCAEPFKEREKYEMNLQGIWVPTVKEPLEPLHRGYTLNALYPYGLRSWVKLISHYMKAYPSAGIKDESVEQAFYNIVLAKPYVKSNDDMKATDLMVHNRRPYSPGIVPEDLSIRDGNGKIIMLTCSVDLNGIYLKEGREDDVRLDWEILAWSEGGQTYSVSHGSIGTFVYRETEEQKQVYREKWTYDHTKPNNVWKELDKILLTEWLIGGTSRKAKILMTVVDTGNWEAAVFEYVDSRANQFMIVGVKGAPESKVKPLDRESRNFKESAARPGTLFIVDGHSIKDNLAGLMRMKWRSGTGELQPVGFMNYPTDSRELVDEKERKYTYDNFFSHYEAEHKVEDTDKKGYTKGFVWKKKSTSLQNHCLDLRVYNLAACEIFLHFYLKELKKMNPARWKEINYFSWRDFVELNKQLS